jgi:hypothetical protein
MNQSPTPIETGSFERVEILSSKKKIILVLLGTIIVVALGILFAIMPDVFETRRYGLLTTRVAGIGCILIFGFCCIASVKKLFDKKVGLVIDSNGITDNSSGTSVGYIPWKDIIGIEIFIIHGQKIIAILVNNPDEYISRQKNLFRQKTLEWNYNLCGSPISLSANTLICKHNELERILREQYEKYGNHAN